MNDAVQPTVVRLFGEVAENSICDFVDALGQAPDDRDIVVEVTTPGGDAEMARRAVRALNEKRQHHSAKMKFLGKTEVYSGGVTIMAAFPKQERFLSSDAVLLNHCRQLDKSIELSGPIRASLALLESAQNQIELGIKLEDDNFKRLIEGSDISLEEIQNRALHNWYVSAEEAIKRGLIAGIE